MKGTFNDAKKEFATLEGRKWDCLQMREKLDLKSTKISSPVQMRGVE